MQYASFYVDQDLYAIPVLLVEEFLRPAIVTSVPLTDWRIEGLVNLRGKTATVLNLRSCFNKERRKDAHRSKMILVETTQDLSEEARVQEIRSHEEPVVLRVDGIHRILNAEPEELRPPPAHVEFPFVEGIIRIEEQYVTLLSIPRLIGQILQSEGA